MLLQQSRSLAVRFRQTLHVLEIDLMTFDQLMKELIRSGVPLAFEGCGALGKLRVGSSQQERLVWVAGFLRESGILLLFGFHPG